MRRRALIAGPTEHGVVRHGAALAAALDWPVSVRTDAGDVAPDELVVAEFADRLFGPTAEASAAAFARAAERVHTTGSRLVVSLHDVPVDDGSALAARRVTLYRGVVAAADAVLVASEVDATRLRALGPAPARLAVVPLPVPPALAVPEPRPAGAESVTVLGFLYPGKGHEEVAAALPRDLPLLCAGRPSDGHDDLVDTLRELHPATTVTGFVDDAELAPMLQAATVPVAPNRVVGSSASITTWWAHGRRPLVPDAPLPRELATRWPGALSLYPAAGLAAAITAARLDPASTWLTPAAWPVDPPEAVARRRETVLQRWFG